MQWCLNMVWCTTQKYLQSMGTRVEEMRVKRRDTELWMSHRMLPDELKQRVRRYEQYKWQENRGVDEEYLIHDLPKDLRRDIKRHLCLNLLMRVSNNTLFTFIFLFKNYRSLNVTFAYKIVDFEIWVFMLIK